MQSETRIKIKEARIRYFKELGMQRTEKRKGLKNPAPIPVFPQASHKYKLDFLQSVKWPKFNYQKKVSHSANRIRIYSGRLTKQVSEAKNSLAGSYQQQTEKMKDQLVSIMLTLFDT